MVGCGRASREADPSATPGQPEAAKQVATQYLRTWLTGAAGPRMRQGCGG